MPRKQRTYARFTEFTEDDGDKVRYSSLIPTFGNLRELRHMKAAIANLKRYSIDLDNLVKEGDLTPEDTVLEGHLIWKDRFAKMLHKWATAEVLDFFMHGHLPQDLLVGGKRTKIYYNDAVPGLEPEEPEPAPEPDAQPKRFVCMVNTFMGNRSYVFILLNRNDREINRLRHAISESSYHKLYLQLDPSVSFTEQDFENPSMSEVPYFKLDGRLQFEKSVENMKRDRREHLAHQTLMYDSIRHFMHKYYVR